MTRSAAEWEATPTPSPRDYVDARVYGDPAVFAEERERILAKTWRFVCHTSEVADPGDYRTLDFAGTPLIVARGEDEVVRTFINVCSHRSAAVLRAPAGNATTWTCVFHQWSYDTRGNCTGIPRQDGFDAAGVCPEKVGLRAVRTAVRLGMVFVNLDDAAPEFDVFAGGALEPLAPIMGTDVELEVFHIHRSTIAANWKSWHETQMEIYHEYLHYLNRRISFRADNYHDRKWRIFPGGHGTIEPLRHRYDQASGLSDRSADLLPGLGPNENRLVDLFPDTSIHCRATVMRIDTTIPLAPNLTVVERRGLGIKGEPAAIRAKRVAHHNQFWGPFGRNHPEDCIAAALVEPANRHGAARHALIARHEDLRAQDDEMLRAYYDTWGRYMSRSAADLSRRGRAAE